MASHKLARVTAGWPAGRGQGGGGGQGLSFLRAAGWNTPIFSVISTGSISSATETGFSSVIGDGRPFPCLGHKKSMIGEGENKACALMG